MSLTYAVHPYIANTRSPQYARAWAIGHWTIYKRGSESDFLLVPVRKLVQASHWQLQKPPHGNLQKQDLDQAKSTRFDAYPSGLARYRRSRGFPDSSPHTRNEPISLGQTAPKLTLPQTRGTWDPNYSPERNASPDRSELAGPHFTTPSSLKSRPKFGRWWPRPAAASRPVASVPSRACSTASLRRFSTARRLIRQRLISTLNNAHMSRLSPTAASLVQTLSLLRLGARSYWIPVRQCLAALKGLVKISRGGVVIQGSSLRVLKWDLAEGTKQLARLLRKPDYFPNLKEISVKCEGESPCFDIPNLEKMECIATLCASSHELLTDEGGLRRLQTHETWRPIWNALGAALMALPSSSLLLKTLNLTLCMVAASQEFESAPWDAYAALINTINRMQFSALTSVALTVRGCKPRTNFSPLLRSHPSLANLTLCVDGMHTLPYLDPASLPHLRSFTGSFKECAIVSARARELEHLTIKFPDSFLDSDDSPLFSSQVLPSAVSPTVTHLSVRAFNEDYCRVLGYGHELSARSFDCLARAFPNITHLELFLGEELVIVDDSFAALPGLESLCIRERRRVQEELKLEPATAIFPAAEYTSQFNTALFPFLAHPADVHIILEGDRSADDWDDPYAGPSLPDLLLEYWFSMDRECEAKLVLVDYTASEES
ncbi:hypothetical protein FB451DRAFT_1183387 [Mycena latifolia]|nr:hypothetical protein FB451DRAFT_1183387 [Mycena latifolia]